MYAAERRYTTAHSRYHVIGFLGGEGEIIEAAQSRAEAMRIAVRSIGPRRFESAHVFDTMARHRQAQCWDASSQNALYSRI